MAGDCLTFKCHACNMSLSVPLHLAGVESPCPGCGENIIAPIPARPAALAKAAGFTQSLKKPDDLVSVIAERNSTAAPEAESSTEEARPSLMHSVFVPVSTAAPPPPLPEPETVEELLKDVKFTVVETNKTRALMLQLAALVVVLVPVIWFSPTLWKQLETKLGPALGLTPPKQEETIKKAEPTNNVQRRRLINSPADNFASVPISSSGGTDWKPHQQGAVSATFRQQNPHQARSFAGTPVMSSSHSPVWGAPVRQQRVTRFVSGPRMTSISSGSGSGSAAPSPYVGGGGGGGGGGGYAPVADSYIDDSVGGGGAPAIGYTSGDQSTEIIYAASLLEIADAVKGTPEWMRQHVELWPPVVLQNDGTMRGGQSWVQGTPCLVVEAGSDLWIVTPTRMLGEEGGISPPINPADLSRNMVKWNAVCPATGKNVASVTNSHLFIHRHNASVLALKAPRTDASSSVKTLRLRSEALTNGTRVYLAAPAPDNISQLVFAARVTKGAKDASDVQITLDHDIPTTAFIGGAVIDQAGVLAGVVVSAHSKGVCSVAQGKSIEQLISSK